jgi:hypothetical protein
MQKYLLEEAFELAEPGPVHVIGGNHLAKATRPTRLEVLQPVDHLRQTGEAGGAGTLATSVPQPA